MAEQKVSPGQIRKPDSSKGKTNPEKERKAQEKREALGQSRPGDRIANPPE